MYLSPHAEYATICHVPHRITVQLTPGPHPQPAVTITPLGTVDPKAPNRRRIAAAQARRLLPRLAVTDSPVTLRFSEDPVTHALTSLLDSSPKPPPHMRGMTHRHTFQ